MRASLPFLARDERGATIVEFAIVAPVMILLLVGSFDFAHTLYTRAVLQGVVQKTARDSALETGADQDADDALDAKVTAMVKPLANNATLDFKRRYYRSFTSAQAAKAETYTDTNLNGKCDAGEPFIDTNSNGVWDKDGADGGQGGARDATLYTVTMTYPRMFPLPKMLSGGSNSVKLVAQTILKNQPYGDQATYAPPTIRNCT